MILSVQSLSCVRLFVTPWTEVCQASLSITNSQSLLKLMSIKSVMLSNHLIPCLPLLLLPSFFPSIRAFSNDSILRIRWPKHWILSHILFFHLIPIPPFCLHVFQCLRFHSALFLILGGECLFFALFF